MLSKNEDGQVPVEKFGRTELKSKSNFLITSNHFANEYQIIIDQLSTINIDTDRTETLNRLQKNIIKIKESTLSSDAKIVALIDIFIQEFAVILSSMGGANSRLGLFIKDYCINHFGLELGKDLLCHLKPEGLMLRILQNQWGIQEKNLKEDSLLPPVKKKEQEDTPVSKSAPEYGIQKKIASEVTHSVDIGSKANEINQINLRKNKELSRLGTMFGANQWCYAEKPSGVEPGFRAIDLNELFFQEIEKILADKQLASEEQLSDEEKIILGKLGDALKVEGLSRKRMVFASFINAYMKGPHEKNQIQAHIQWLCQAIKKEVAVNNQFSAWMFKLDYAEQQKDRVKANKEALREFVGTRLAGIFSAQNQNQEIIWVKGITGVHALLACGWKNGLKELTEFLYGGSEPDYNGILVEDKKAQVKISKYIPGLAKNLIFGIAIGDRDGMGKDAQNKGFADGAFYGFDYGKPYEGAGVCSSLSDDFTFEDPFANTPSIFRGSSTIGVARHYMYRNYSVFYDTDLSDRMLGFHLLRKMITGNNPSEDVIKSYPGLTQELHRIQERTPSPQELFMQLGDIRSKCKVGNPLQPLVDTYIMQLSTNKLTHFDLYFCKIKFDLLDIALKNNMSFEEISGYIKFIDEMLETAHKNNEHILVKFAERMLLTKQEIDLLDNLEKYFSPTSVMSPDGEVFLRGMRLDTHTSRVPFQLKRGDERNYILTTTNIKILRQLKEDFNLECVQGEKGLSCILTPEHLNKLSEEIKVKNNQKKEKLLIKPTYQLITFPNLFHLLNHLNAPDDPKAIVQFLWREDNSLSLCVIAKTEEQVRLVQQIFEILPKINAAEIIEILPEKHHEFQHEVAQLYNQTRMQVEKREDVISALSRLSTQSPSSKWEKIHKKQEISEGSALSMQLIQRFRRLINDQEVLQQIIKVIEDIIDPSVIEQLMQYNDQTLTSSENIAAIIEEQFDAIQVISEDEVTLTSVLQGDSQQKTI